MKDLIGKTAWKIGADGTAYAYTIGGVAYGSKILVLVRTGEYGDARPYFENASEFLFTPEDVRLEYARRVAELGRKAAEFDNSLEAENAVAKAA